MLRCLFIRCLFIPSWKLNRYWHWQSLIRRNKEGKWKRKWEPNSIVGALTSIDRIINNVKTRNSIQYPQMRYSYTIIPQWKAWDPRGHIITIRGCKESSWRWLWKKHNWWESSWLWKCRVTKWYQLSNLHVNFFS